MSPDLSVIIPVYNEEKRIGGSLQTIVAYLAEHGIDWEIIVVDDGSTDQTVQVVKAVAADFPDIHLIQNEHNQGKGAVIRQGMLLAKGQQILFSDADLSTPIGEYQKLNTALQEGVDVAIGSRALAQSKLLVKQPLHRQLFGKFFNLLVRLFYLPSLHDTQCGFKLFTRKAARAIFEKQQIDSLVFDVEVLYLARILGLKIQEIPVSWINSEDSKFKTNLRNAFLVFRDLAKIRWLHS